MSFVSLMIWLGVAFACFTVGIIIGSYHSALVTMNKFTLKQFASVMTVHLDNGIYYLYDQSSGEFVLQEDSLEKLSHSLLTKKNNTLTYVIDENLNTYWFINGKVKYNQKGIKTSIL